MKPEVSIMLKFGGLEHVVSFEKIEEIDDLMSTLEEARAELEHHIEMERQRRREKRKRAKMRRKEDKKEVMHLPIKLKNGDSFFVTCNDVVFNPEYGIFNYIMNNEVILSIPVSSMEEEPILNKR